MTFSTGKHIVALTLLWAGTLILCDRLLSWPGEFGRDLLEPKVEAVTALAPTPQVRLWVSPVGCTGDLEALRALPGLGEATVVARPADRSGAPCERAVLVEVRDLQRVDLAALGRALRALPGLGEATVVARPADRK